MVHPAADQWQQLELVQHRVRAFQLRAAALEADLAPVGVDEQFVDGRLGAVVDQFAKLFGQRFRCHLSDLPGCRTTISGKVLFDTFVATYRRAGLEPGG